MVFICWQLIPVYLAMTFIGGATLCFIGVVFALQTQSSCRSASEDLITKHLSSLRVYGIKGVVGEDAIMNYLNVLTDNLTNVLVLINI